jgi:hypothetical protein
MLHPCPESVRANPKEPNFFLPYVYCLVKIFVITAYELTGKPLSAYKRRQRGR